MESFYGCHHQEVNALKLKFLVFGFMRAEPKNNERKSFLTKKNFLRFILIYFHENTFHYTPWIISSQEVRWDEILTLYASFFLSSWLINFFLLPFAWLIIQTFSNSSKNECESGFEKGFEKVKICVAIQNNKFEFFHFFCGWINKGKCSGPMNDVGADYCSKLIRELNFAEFLMNIQKRC